MDATEAPRLPNQSETPFGLRVAMVTETYPPEVNGVAITVARLVQGLANRGHRVQVIRPRQGTADVPAASPNVSELLTHGVPIPRYPELKAGLPAGRRLARAWNDFCPDVVHVATEGPLGWSAMQTARRLRLPVVSEFRTNFHAYSRHYGIGILKRPILAYLRTFHNRTACTMVPTPALAQELAGAGFERLRVVGRGVETGRFNPGRRSPSLRQHWGANDSSPVVVAVGRLAPEKNLELLCDAFDRIQARCPEARLVLVGDGPARPWIAKRCPQAILAGRREGDDLAAHYASADLMLFPSLTETFGNVTIEGMASGLPVVAFAYGAAGEHIVTGNNGWTARYGESHEYLALVDAAIADPAKCRQLGQAARATAELMGWDRIVGQVEAHYRQARNWAADTLGALARSELGETNQAGAAALGDTLFGQTEGNSEAFRAGENR